MAETECFGVGTALGWTEDGSNVGTPLGEVEIRSEGIGVGMALGEEDSTSEGPSVGIVDTTSTVG